MYKRNSPLKQTKALHRNGLSQGGAGRLQKSWEQYLAPASQAVLEKPGAHERHGNQLEDVLTGQIWDALSTKINNDGNREWLSVYFNGIHESTLSFIKGNT